MSSSDRPRRLAILFAACLLGLSACQVRPLYGPGPAGTETLASLEMVDVSPTAGRVGQEVRNELLFLLNGGTPAATAYILDLRVDSTASGILVRNFGGLPSGGVVTVSADYRLRVPGAEKPLFTARLARQASFERSNQRFANDRAELDAENRAAKEVAEAIRLSLATFFASNGRSLPGTAPVVAPSIEELNDIPDFEFIGEETSDEPFAPRDDEDDEDDEDGPY